MLHLFRNIFSQTNDPGAGLTDTLLRAAIERAVDGTDPRVRIHSGYAKALRKSVSHALLHIIDLVEALPAPVTMSKQSLMGNPAFAAVFYSEERMEQIVSRDAALREFRAASAPVFDTVTALLLVRRNEKHGFGHALLGDQVLSDAPRTTVSFDKHLLLEPALSEQETRRLLKRRAFDYLLSVALSHIVDHKQERDALNKQKTLLRTKLDVMRRGGGFDEHNDAPAQLELQQRLENIDAQLAELGSTRDALADNLAMTAAVLAEAQKYLQQQDEVLYLDKLYVRHDKPGPSAPAVTFRELRNSDGHASTVLMLSIPPLLTTGYDGRGPGNRN